MKVLVTIPLKPAQYISITEDKAGTKFIYICNRKCIVQATQSDPKRPTRYVATVNLPDLNIYLEYAQKLNSKGVEFYYATY